MWIIRQVWKPFECAEMPRMACMDTGRPTILSCFSPRQSVPGNIQGYFLLECNLGQFGRDPPYCLRRYICLLRDRAGRIPVRQEIF